VVPVWDAAEIIMANMNPRLTLTRIFTFDTAHSLDNYPGKCRHIHGHTYTLFVTIEGPVINENGHPYDGMIMDFSDIKNWVHEAVLKKFDHFLLLRKGSELSKIEYPEWDHVYLTSYQPSCENILMDISGKLLATIPDGIRLSRVKLHETPTAFAEVEF
jgi:6-pyruvoyltetrahydropterin/6-carboxytetrahydropterin synthase